MTRLRSLLTSTMKSTAPGKVPDSGGGAAERRGSMEEKVYKTMSGAGAMSIAVGVVALVTGIVCGILMIIGGSKLLAHRSKILF